MAIDIYGNRYGLVSKTDPRVISGTLFDCRKGIPFDPKRCKNISEALKKSTKNKGENNAWFGRKKIRWIHNDELKENKRTKAGEFPYWMIVPGWEEDYVRAYDPRYTKKFKF